MYSGAVPGYFHGQGAGETRGCGLQKHWGWGVTPQKLISFDPFGNYWCHFGYFFFIFLFCYFFIFSRFSPFFSFFLFLKMIGGSQPPCPPVALPLNVLYNKSSHFNKSTFPLFFPSPDGYSDDEILHDIVEPAMDAWLTAYKEEEYLRISKAVELDKVTPICLLVYLTSCSCLSLCA